MRSLISAFCRNQNSGQPGCADVQNRSHRAGRDAVHQGDGSRLMRLDVLFWLTVGVLIGLIIVGGFLFVTELPGALSGHY